jgi:hypothetical protein
VSNRRRAISEVNIAVRAHQQMAASEEIKAYEAALAEYNAVLAAIPAGQAAAEPAPIKPAKPSTYKTLFNAAKKLNRREQAALASYESSSLAKHSTHPLLDYQAVLLTMWATVTSPLTPPLPPPPPPPAQEGTMPEQWAQAAACKFAIAVGPLARTAAALASSSNTTAQPTADVLASLAKAYAPSVGLPTVRNWPQSCSQFALCLLCMLTRHLCPQVTGHKPSSEMYNNILGQYPKAYLDPQPVTKVNMAA